MSQVVEHAESFASTNNDAEVQFLQAVGSAGIAPAADIVKRTWYQMLLLYADVMLSIILFRN